MVLWKIHWEESVCGKTKFLKNEQAKSVNIEIGRAHREQIRVEGLTWFLSLPKREVNGINEIGEFMSNCLSEYILLKLGFFFIK